MSRSHDGTGGAKTRDDLAVALSRSCVLTEQGAECRRQAAGVLVVLHEQGKPRERTRILASVDASVDRRGIGERPVAARAHHRVDRAVESLDASEALGDEALGRRAPVAN